MQIESTFTMCFVLSVKPINVSMINHRRLCSFSRLLGPDRPVDNSIVKDVLPHNFRIKKSEHFQGPQNWLR